MNLTNHREFAVYAYNGAYLGTASNFRDAKAMQLASLPDDLRDAYAGIGSEGYPVFYHTPSLAAKYPEMF